MFEIDLLPRRMLFDTSILLRAWGFADDPMAPLCLGLFETACRHGRTVVVAAPSVAEILRGGEGREIPHVRHVEVVPFDQRSAVIAGRSFPSADLRAAEGNRTAIKADAMILGCGSRWKASCVVTLDGRMRQMASAVNLDGRAPGDFLERQLPLLNG